MSSESKMVRDSYAPKYKNIQGHFSNGRGWERRYRETDLARQTRARSDPKTQARVYLQMTGLPLQRLPSLRLHHAQ